MVNILSMRWRTEIVGFERGRKSGRKTEEGGFRQYSWIAVINECHILRTVTTVWHTDGAVLLLDRTEGWNRDFCTFVPCGDQYLKSLGDQHLLNARYLPYRRNVIGHSALETFCKMLFLHKACYISPQITSYMCLACGCGLQMRYVFTVQ